MPPVPPQEESVITKLSESLRKLRPLLARGDLADDARVEELLRITQERRRIDLSDLSPKEQARLVAARCQALQPSEEALAQRVEARMGSGRPFVAKFGIDPTGHEVHLGHAVPMLLLSRFQRMGHRVVFIVGDVTAKIGDPSGRSDERPPLTDADIAANLATYRDQVSPFFDFSAAEFRHNGDWLRSVTLPRLIEICAHIPLSMPLQREDFRKRLDAGHGLSLAELLYSVAMALDSVEVEADLEVGGIDQFLNMQMCRKVMEISGQDPEVVAATALIEGTDGSGAKMSKSRGNYVPLTAPPGEAYGKMMSVPDRLVDPYLRALSEWDDSELSLLGERLADASLHPMDAKKLLAGEVTAALHGVEAAMAARADFVAQFSARKFSEVQDIPLVADAKLPVVEIARSLGFAKSNSELRRLASQGAVRLLTEGAEPTVLDPKDTATALSDLLAEAPAGDTYLKVGRKLARIVQANRGQP